MAAAESHPLLPEKIDASFTKALQTRRGAKPQTIAHRGYNAAFPENTMSAFRGAVDVGAHALETDIHISKDGVVVLSHDGTLKRCFGKDEKIIDCDWEYLETLRTVQAPHEPMPRLKDLLEYLASPGLEEIWVLLDIKLDVDPDDVMRLIAATLEEVKPSQAWNERILLGIWTTSYVPLCSKYLPEYPMAYIGFSIPYARQFLKVDGVSFNMFQKTLVGPSGNCFLRSVRAAGRSIFLWTVNEEVWMKWSIKKEVDGVITDDPKKFLEVCKEYEGEKIRLSLKDLGSVVWVNVLVIVFGWMFRYKYSTPLPAKKT